MNDPVWDTVQSISVDEGVPTKLWVRIVNRGCEPITGFSVSLAEADYALIAADWQYVDQVDPQKEFPNETLDPGEAIVVGFDWVPEVDGHRCLLAAVNSEVDPTIVPLDQNDLMDFGELAGPDKAFTPLDNNLAQRNITVADTDNDPGAIGNPFPETIAMGVEFDCNDFPIFGPGAVAKLVVDEHPALAQAWSDVPGTTLVDTGSELELTFHTCKVRLPDAILPGFTNLAADMVLVLPPSTFGTFLVDLTAYVNGLQHGGASFFVQQLTPPPG